jgi:hypothetical protein
VQTNRDDVLFCDGCGTFFAANKPDSLEAWFLDGTSVDFCSAACERQCFERGAQLYGGRGTILLLAGRTPAEWLAGQVYPFLLRFGPH